MAQNTETSFIMEFGVGSKTIQIDAFLVVSELTLSGKEHPSNDDMIQSIRQAVGEEVSGTLSDKECFALSLRVSLALKNLGKNIAP